MEPPARRTSMERDMGTRADFYVGRGKDAEWLGSIAWDGYPSGLDAPQLLAATGEPHYREEVASLLAKRDDGTVPADGWPWPWKDSGTTDYAYAFDNGKVWAWSHRWFVAKDSEPDEEDEDSVPEVAVFPDMTDRQMVTLGKRSGVIII